MEGGLDRRGAGDRDDIPSEVDRTLEAWIDAWQLLIAELQAAGGAIDASIRERWRQAQRILAENPSIRYWLANLDNPHSEREFGSVRFFGADGRRPPPIDRAWLARMREQHAAWEKLDVTDWSGPTVPGTQILSEVTIGDQQNLADFLLSLHHATPPEKWTARARAVASGRERRHVRRALILWLETLPIIGDGEARARLGRDATAYEALRHCVMEDTGATGSAEAAALLAFFGLGVRVGRRADEWMFPGQSYRRDPALLSDAAGRLVRAAAWMLANWRDDEVVAVLHKAAGAMLARVEDGTTYRSLLAANACILALGEIASPEAVQALGRIKLRIRDERLAKQIAKAMEAAAARAGMTVADLQELSAPDHGLDEVGAKSLRLGDFNATLRVLSTTRVTVEVARVDGTVLKSVPATVKNDAENRAALKQLKDLAKEVAQALPVHRQRLDSLYLTRRSWPVAIWRERYLDQPAVGTIARRLIWTIAEPDGTKRSVLWHEDGLVDAQGVAAQRMHDDCIVTLWHPLEAPPGDVAAWRAFLMENRLVQPFKQAHRELYPLTDAERTAALYSNRFAGHILRQHQSVALARLRGWRATLRVCADVPNDQPTHVRIPDYGLAAELWTEAAGGDAPELTDSGIYVFIATDRVRFRRLSEAEGRDALGDPVPFESVPPRVFSEVMRDVDLFVGVASIGNDPTWNDRGADAEHPNQWARDYWHRHAAAPLNASGESRKQLLAELIPSLAIADRCAFSDRHLVVRGRLRTYRIHLGSGNVLMDNDRYLCIVQPRGRDDGVVFLPFEGDGMLSLILSKAVMLAADDQITDATILSQFQRS